MMAVVVTAAGGVSRSDRGGIATSVQLLMHSIDLIDLIIPFPKKLGDEESV